MELFHNFVIIPNCDIMRNEEGIIDDTYIEQLIDAAYVGGKGRFFEVQDSGKSFARLEGGVYSYRSPKTYGQVRKLEGVELRKLKNIFFGLIAKYMYFKIPEHHYRYRNGKWYKTMDLGK